MKFGTVIAAAALLAITAGARADIVFTPGPSSAGGLENILFNEAGLVSTGTTVEGISNQTAFQVNFTSATELTTPAQGQARITATTGNYQDLAISLADPAASFTRLTLNILAAADGTVNFSATDDDGAVWNSDPFAVSGNGQNNFNIEAINGQRIKSVSFTSSVGIEDVRQVRIGGLGTGEPDAIPEPGSMALLAMGALPLLGLRRRK